VSARRGSIEVYANYYIGDRENVDTGVWVEGFAKYETQVIVAAY